MKNLKILVASIVLTATSAVFAGQEISGKQLMLKDPTVGVSGLWNWIAAKDNFDIGTEMVPDSGTSPLFAKEDGSIFAEAAMKIGPEPEWTPETAGTLKYPFAYIEMRFKKDECVQNSSCGVNLAALGIKYIHIRSKVSGPIRMSVLNERTTESGAEPGVLIPNSTEYMSTQYDLTPFKYGFKGFDDHNNGGVPKWTNYDKAPLGSEIIKQVTGLRWEISDSHGASGTISIESIEFIDGLGNVIDAFNITGMEGVRTNINDPLHNEIANGKQQALKDSTIGVSGLWNWIAAKDNFDIGTEMVPDSGTSPLFAKEDGSIFAEAAMKIGPEPEWTPETADTLKYPFAYIEMRFKKDECVQDSSCGVDLSALGVKYIRITSKVSGPIRMSVLNEKTAEPGTEPGVLILNSSEYKPLQYDLTPFEYGFKGFNNHNNGGVPKWTNYDKAPLGSEILKHATGLRWEISDSHGASGAISIKSIEFIDGSGNVIDAFNITGMEGVRSVIALESSSSSAEPESSSAEPESSSAEPESSSAEPESSSAEPESSSSAVKPKSSSSAVKPKSSSSAVKPKSSSSAVKSKSSSSVKAKSSSSKKSKSSSSAAPKSSSSSSKKKTALPQKHFTSMVHITVSGKQILISNATPGSDYAVFTMQGKVIMAGKIQNRVENITLQDQGAFLVRVGHEIFKVK